MRVLLSAYACEPDRGSEPEVGWRWAIGLAERGHEVWVITRANNRPVIEAAASCLPPGVRFAYYDLPRPFLGLKRWLGVNVYYRLWQTGAARLAKRLHEEVRFDRTHHVTFVAARHPSFLRTIDVPFIFGPVAGGEHAPAALLADLPWRYRWREQVRTLATRVLMRTPSVRSTASAASAIYATSAQTAALFAREVAPKVRLQLAITSDSALASSPDAEREEDRSDVRFLFAGHLLHWKGIHLALRALGLVRKTGVEASLTIVGDGPARDWLQRVARDAGVARYVRWIAWVKRSELTAYYASHDVFVFPSLRDSGGMVVMEAMAHALPVICLDAGGPGVIVDETCGFVIRVDQPADRVVEGIANAFARLVQEDSLRAAMGAAAPMRLGEFTQAKMFAAMGY